MTVTAVKLYCTAPFNHDKSIWKAVCFFDFSFEAFERFSLDCKQSLSGQSRWCAHSAARLERGEIISPKPPSTRSLQFFRLFRATSTIQKGTVCSLCLKHLKGLVQMFPTFDLTLNKNQWNSNLCYVSTEKA